MDLPKLLPLTWQSLLFISFLFSVIVLLLYYLLLFSRLAFYKTQPKTTRQTHPVTVVICARDEAENLALNLHGALLQQYNTTHEVIVVNDNSYDDSKYVLEALQKEFRQLRIVELKQEAKMIPGKKFPLSMGIKEAKYEMLLLTDADCTPASEEWIQKMQDAYAADTEIVLGYGPQYKQKGILNKLTRFETFLSALQYFSYALAGIPYMGVGRNLSYKKNLFIKNKGFSALNHLPGGDDDLFINAVANAKNTKICIDAGAFTFTKAPDSFEAWSKQKRRHYTTSKYYKGKHKFFLGLFALVQFAFYPLLFTSAYFFNWQWTLITAFVKYAVQGVVFFRSMKKLGEQDLFPGFILLDLWMFFYYLIFAPSLVKKPAQTWK